MANNEDIDQKLCSVVADLGLHCLLKPDFQKLWIIMVKATHIFSAKIPVNLILYLLEHLTF